MIKFVPYTPKSKGRCPSCGRAKTFTYFMDTDTGERFPPEYGVCDRVESCSYSLRPDKDSKGEKVVFIPEPPRPVYFLDMNEVTERMANDGQNYFFDWLDELIGKGWADALKKLYRLGTSLEHEGFVSFPLIDIDQNLRQIKEMKYDSASGKRIHEKGSQRWSHEKWKYPDLNLQLTYFGSHLLKEDNKPVALVESEKSAVLASHFIPKFTWIATGSLTLLTNERCQQLQGMDLTLFPDLLAYPLWKNKAKFLKGMRSINVSDYLEVNAQRFNLQKGDDIADLIIKKIR